MVFVSWTTRSTKLYVIEQFLLCDNVKIFRAREKINICINPAEPAISTQRGI